MDDRGCGIRDATRRASRSAKPARWKSCPKFLPRAGSSKGAFLTCASTTFVYADGSEHRLDVVEHGASLAIVATPTPREVVLVRQYRHAARAILWEVPAGSAEHGEIATDGARRELREETGYRTGRIRHVGSVWTTPGFCSEIMHFFHADGSLGGRTQFDDDERIEVASFAFGGMAVGR